MSKTRTPAVEPEVATKALRAQETVFADEVETWMHSQGFAAPTVTWSHRGRGAMWLHDPGHLAERIGGLSEEGAWAVIRRTHAPRWAQCMRVDGGWIVEVNGVPGPDCYSRRVQGAHAGRLRGLVGHVFGRRRVEDAGRVMAVYLPQDVIGTPVGVAEIVWAWLRGVVTEGYELREL